MAEINPSGGWLERSGQTLAAWAGGLAQALFTWPSTRRQSRLASLWLAALYLLGIFLWGQFLNWGSIPFDFHDWAEISAPRLAFVRDAVSKGVLPLHMPDASALRGVTDRFMTIPDAVLSPQVLLMPLMDVGTFVLLNTWLLYTLGFAGLLWFHRRYRLSPVVFGVIFLLFNFNGHILSHFSVGHVNYTGYLLFPWLAALTILLLEGKGAGWGWAAKTAGLLFFILLQGSFHQFVWAVLFLGLVGLFNWKRLPAVLRALVCAGLLSAVRLLPPALELGKWDNEFLSGYTSLWDLLRALVELRPPSLLPSAPAMLTTLGWWEFDLYVGLAGAAILLWFGLVSGLQKRRTLPEFSGMALPAFTLFVFSIGRLYRLILLLPIPLLAGERVSARLISLPFVLLVLAAGIHLQRWLDERKPSTALLWAQAGLFALLLHDLWQHLKLWRVDVATGAFPVTPVNLAIKVVANHPDAPYTTLLAVGAGITLLTAVALGVLWGRERKSRL